MSFFWDDQDTIAFIALFIPRIDAELRNRFPKGFIDKPHAGIVAVPEEIISELFGINRAKFISMIKHSKHGFSLAPAMSQHSITGELKFKETISAAEAGQNVVKHLFRLGYSTEQLKALRYYISAKEDLKIYLVIAGNLSNPPAQTIIGDFPN